MTFSAAHNRTLTVGQHRRLGRLEDEEPETKVVGWQLGGPVLRRPLKDRLFRINRMGRMIAARAKENA